MNAQEIEVAITKLPDGEWRQLWSWLEEYAEQRWDEQIEQDSRAGRFDELIANLKAKIDRGESEAF